MKKLFNALGILFVLSTATAFASPIENHLRSEHYEEFGLTKITFDSLLRDCNVRTIGKQCYYAGVYFIDKRREATTGLKYMNKACTVGYSKACRVIGDHYREGRIIEYNPIMAKKYYDIGCRKGSTLACNKYNNYFPTKNTCTTPLDKPENKKACPDYYKNLYDYDKQSGL